MTSITPYSGKFAGRTIKSGKLSMDLKYQIQDSKLVGDKSEPVGEPDLMELARNRAQSVSTELQSACNVAADRIATKDPEPPSDDKGPSVRLTLDTLSVAR